MRNFNADVLIEHINVRKEGAEKETLVLDVKLGMMVDADTVDDLMCQDINDGECHRCFWLSNEAGDPRFENMENVKFKRSYKNVSVEMMEMEFQGCSLTKFSFQPMPADKAYLVFSMAVREPPAIAIDRLASMLLERMPAKFWMPQGDLLETATEKSAPAISDDETLSFLEVQLWVIDNKKASISAVQRQFGIGYNHAARYIERMEANGVVSQMDNKGARTVLA